MNEQQTMQRPQVQAVSQDEISVIQLLTVLVKHKRRIVMYTLGCAAIATVVSLALPDVFTANTKLLPPQQNQSGAAALLSQLGGMAGAAAGVAGLKSPNDLYIGMLKSRTIADLLIAKYDLKTAYETTSQEKTRKTLEENTLISAGKDGLITIEVEDRDRKRAVKIANSYVDELAKLNKQLAVTEAAQRRVFFEQQLDRAKDNLANAEVALKRSFDTGGVISVDAETRAIVETVGRVRAQVSAKEIQLNSMQAFVTSSNPEYRRVQEELASLRAELAKLENGRANGNQGAGGTEGVPQSGLQNIKILRDVKYYQMLYELLAKQYEVARLDEAKDPSLIQVLDRAMEPEQKSKPKRSIIVILAAVLGLIAGVCSAFFIETRKKMLDSPASAARWAELKSYL